MSRLILTEFTKHPRCVKCHGVDVSVKHYERKVVRSEEPDRPEALAVTCQTCGFCWCMSPADAGEEI